jgi:hypothetical protein
MASAQGHQEPGIISQDEALIKPYYLALCNISKEGTMPIQNCKTALNGLTIMFGQCTSRISRSPGDLESWTPSAVFNVRNAVHISRDNRDRLQSNALQAGRQCHRRQIPHRLFKT